MKNITLRIATYADTESILPLMQCLFEEHSADDLRLEIKSYINGPDTCIYIAMDDNAIGFAQCSIRRDYVEGSAKSPVGYLEGVYISPTHRKRGIARALVSACELWAMAHDCTEFGSDCPLTNTESIAFHKGIGFSIANKLVCFIKAIGSVQDT